MDASLVSSFRTYGLSELRVLMRTEDNLCICNQPTVLEIPASAFIMNVPAGINTVRKAKSKSYFWACLRVMLSIIQPVSS